MASFFGEIIEPSSRALFDDCSDEEINESLSLQIDWNSDYKTKLPDFNTLLIVDSPLTLAFVEAFILKSTYCVAGVIIGDDNSRKASLATLVLQDKQLICFVQTIFSPSATFDFADLVAPLVKTCKQVTLLTSRPLNTYKSFAGELPTENTVFALTTRQYKAKPLRQFLTESNIITGIPAAVLSWCEIYAVPAVGYVCYADSDVLDSLTAKPLRGLLSEASSDPNLKQKWKFGGVTRGVGNLSNMYM